MQKIPLTRGLFALVDDEDYERVIRHKWCALKCGARWYASAWTGPHKTRRRVSLHRFIMGEPDGHEVDHADGNGLDCRRGNLRVCTKSQNQHNRRPNKNGTSGFKGVGWYEGRGCWRARIQLDGKKMHLGYFDDERSAALAYDAAAKRLHAEFAKLNFVEGGA